MTAEPTRTPEEIRASFVEKVRSFHAGLPAEEQALLELVFALASEAAGGNDAAGFIAGQREDYWLKIERGCGAFDKITLGFYLKVLSPESVGDIFRAPS